MKTRNKVIIAIALVVAVIALIVALFSCNRKAAPDVSSFSTANNQESEVIAESSSVLQSDDSETEVSTDIANTDEAIQTTAQQTGQTTRNTEEADNSSGTETSSPKPSTQTEADPTPVPTTAPSAEPTATPTPEPTPSSEPTPVPTSTPTPVPTESPTPEPTATPTPKPYSIEYVCNSEVILTYTWPSIDDYTDEKYNELFDQAEAIVIERYGEDYLLMNPVHTRT